MMLSDAFVRKLLNPSDVLRYAVDGALIAAVVVAGRLLCRRRRAA